MGWTKWIEWLKEGVKKHTPAGIAKKLAALGFVTAVAATPVVVSAPPPPPPPLTLLGTDKAEGWLQRRMDATKAWINRHPALTGTVAGCVGGSFVPVIGTAIGCVSGATVGYYVGSDEVTQKAAEEKK